MQPDPRDRLFVALDVPTMAEADGLIDRLGDEVSSYKIGLELVFAGGFDLARRLKARGKAVFLDIKLLDIPNTVERATANVAELGVDWLTVHATDTKTLAAAVHGRAGMPLRLLGVTVLTSLERSDLIEQGIPATSPAELVSHRARLARSVGFDGVVASGQEAAVVAAQAPGPFAIVTPGIRLAAGTDGDQARVMSPARAIAAGATHLVVGRPITQAADPAAAARQFVSQISSAPAA